MSHVTFFPASCFPCSVESPYFILDLSDNRGTCGEVLPCLILMLILEATKIMGLFKHTGFQFLGDKHDYLRYGLDSIARYKLTELFLTEHALRELVQRGEMLHHRAIALQKSMTIKLNGGQLEKTNKQFEETQAQYPTKEYALCRAEPMLPSKFKEAYDSLRRDARWFMRKEMIQDCSDRGGCCSRERECCEQRYLSRRKKGRGHCTTECGCCTGFRGFELPEEEKEEIRNI